MAAFMFAICLSSLMFIASRKRSLTSSGAIGAFILGLITFSSSYNLFTFVLLAFFITSSLFTKYKAERKRSIEDSYDTSSQRNLTQVVCNGLTGCITVGLFQLFCENSITCFDETQWGNALVWAYVGHYACCTGDTWASELGVLSHSDPFFIINLKRVRPGTNGGVSLMGLTASAAGGAFVGLAASLSLVLDDRCHEGSWTLIILGTIAGFGGSLIDSILGATVQQTLYSVERKMIVTDSRKDKHTIVISGIDLLDNHQVNFISSLLTALMAGATAWRLYTY